MQQRTRRRETTISYAHYSELAEEAQKLADQVEELARENDTLRDALLMSRAIMREWIRQP